MQQKFIKIITHAGTHHADEVLAIATIFNFAGELPVERKNKAENQDFENPKVLVLDIGNRLDPGKGNFDHHQDGNIPATNMLVLNHFCNDEKLKSALRKQLFSSVDAIDRGISPERPVTDFKIPDFNSIIRSLNNVDNGFDKALKISRLVLSAAIATAQKSIRSEETWNNLEKNNNIAIQHNTEAIFGWHDLAERDGILLLITPNNRIPGSYQIMSRETKLITIPKSKRQLFIHPGGFLAVYPNFIFALKHAEKLTNANKLLFAID